MSITGSSCFVLMFRVKIDRNEIYFCFMNKDGADIGNDHEFHISVLSQPLLSQITTKEDWSLDN